MSRSTLKASPNRGRAGTLYARPLQRRDRPSLDGRSQAAAKSWGPNPYGSTESYARQEAVVVPSLRMSPYWANCDWRTV